MDIQTTAASASIQTKQVAVPETTAKTKTSNPSVVTTLLGDSSKAPSDIINLSAEGFRLSQSQTNAPPQAQLQSEKPAEASMKTATEKSTEEFAREKVVARLKDEIAKEMEKDGQAELEARKNKESTWKTARNAHLDRLQTLIRQGQYKVDPYMLDEIAVRMARMMN